MATKKISALTATTAMANADIIPIYDESEVATRGITYANFKESIGGPALWLQVYSSLGSISTATWTDVEWQETYDSDAMFTAGTSRVNINCVKTGYYTLGLAVMWSAATSATALRQVRLYNVTDATVMVLDTLPYASTVNGATQKISGPGYLESGKVYKVQVYHDEAGSKTLELAGTQTHLTLVYIRSAA